MKKHLVSFRKDFAKHLRQRFAEVKLQDVNSHCLETWEEDEFVKDFLKDNNELFPKDGHRRLINNGHVSIMRLITSVDPHDDKGFIMSGGLSRRAYAVVFDESVDMANDPSVMTDSLSTNYFYTQAEGFFPLRNNKGFAFDASTEHAVMVGGKVDLLVFWFDK